MAGPVTGDTETGDGGEGETGLKQTYLDAIRLIERLHRRFLDVVKSELDRLGMEAGPVGGDEEDVDEAA